MRRTILSEGERSRILNLHKKAILLENPIPGVIYPDGNEVVGDEFMLIKKQLRDLLRKTQDPRLRDEYKRQLDSLYNETTPDNPNENNGQKIPSCESVLKAGDAPGDPPKVSMNGEVVVSNFIDGGPRYNGITFNVNGKPFCRVAISSIGDCKFQSGDPEAPGTSPSQKFTGEVTLSHFIDGGPSNESWSIYNNGKYFCKFR